MIAGQRSIRRMESETQSRPSAAENRSPETVPAERPFPPWLMILVVLLLTFAAYAPTLHYAFVHDDRGQIVENPSVQSWSHLPDYFTKQVWAGFMPGVEGNYYRPVFMIWLRLNDMVWGLHPWGWHLTTVLLHLLSTLLVYFLARRLIHDEFASAVAALLFGLHPVHIEAVAWISGVTEPLLTAFFILAFLCYLRARDAGEHKSRWISLSLLLFVLAMFEKETGVIFPAVVFAYEWIYAGSDREGPAPEGFLSRAAAALKPALPYFALLVPYLAARIYALKGFSHPLTAMPLATILLTLPSLLVFWVHHFFWPAGLSTFYDTHAVSQPTLANFALPALAMILIAALAVAAARRSREVSFALAWIVLPLLPLLDIRVFARNEFAHDRYLYIPSVGLVILAALALRHLPAVKRLRGIPLTQAALILMLSPLMMFGVRRESSYFVNPQTFYEHCARAAPENNLAVTDYAAELGKHGNYSQALDLLTGVVRRDPNFWYGNYNLAFTYYRTGQMDLAEDYFRRAIQLQPGLANQYLYLGLVELKTGRAKEAEGSIRRSLQLDPHNYGSHFALGVILKGRGDLQGALGQFEAEIANYPDENAAQQQVREVRAALHP
jgi:protein O-mannosyl-transferase